MTTWVGAPNTSAGFTSPAGREATKLMPDTVTVANVSWVPIIIFAGSGGGGPVGGPDVYTTSS